MKGSKVCRMHGGKAPQVKQAAANRVMVMEALDRANRMIARAGVEATPEEILWDNLCLANARKIIFGQEVADLDATGNLYQNNYITGTKVPHPAVDEEKYWFKESARIAKDCITLGLKEREVRLAERQGMLVAQIVRAIFGDQAWSAAVRAELQEKGPQVAGRHFRLLESKEAV